MIVGAPTINAAVQHTAVGKIIRRRATHGD